MCKRHLANTQLITGKLLGFNKGNQFWEHGYFDIPCKGGLGGGGGSEISLTVSIKCFF